MQASAEIGTVTVALMLLNFSKGAGPMDERRATTIIGTLLATAGAGATIYLCFTDAGKKQLRQFEQWLDTGIAETTRMMDSLERIGTALATVAGIVGLSTTDYGDPSRPTRSKTVDNLLALPTTLRDAPGPRAVENR
jgi:hypothetical protein